MKSHFTGRGVTYLFPIQVKTFGPVYEGKDLIAQARTGTGKTFSFAIPLIERLQRNQETVKKSRSPKVTIIGCVYVNDTFSVSPSLSFLCCVHLSFHYLYILFNGREIELY